MAPNISASVAKSDGAGSDSGSTGGNDGTKSASADPTTQPAATQGPATPQASASDAIQITVDKPDIATASIVATLDKPDALPAGGLMSFTVEYASGEATPSKAVTLTLAGLREIVPAHQTATQSFPVGKIVQTEDGIEYIETAATATVDPVKKGFTYVPIGNGIYVLLQPELEPVEKKDFPYYPEQSEGASYQYIPAQDKFVSGYSGLHGGSSVGIDVLNDSDIASMSVRFVPGDGHERLTGDWHARRFYRYVYHYAKPEDRAWAQKEWAPMVWVHDTRPNIDKTAAYPSANIGIAFSRGVLEVRAGNAMGGTYPHHYGDLTLAGAHLGIALADPKRWRSRTQGQPYSTHKAIGHAAFFHNVSSSLNLRPLKNMEDSIRELGTSWQALGHRSFYQPSRLYPKQFRFNTFFAFGKIGGVLYPETVTPDDAYAIPCSAAATGFSSAARATGKTIQGECRYNFIEALERLEKYPPQYRPRYKEYRYVGFFANMAELARAYLDFNKLTAQGITDFVQWKDHSAGYTRKALAWMQAEQSMHGLPCGDGLPDCASGFGYEGKESLVIKSGTVPNVTLDLNYGALGSVKPSNVTYRVFKDAPHSYFAGQGTDDPQAYSDKEKAIYDTMIADMRDLRQAAIAPPPRTQDLHWEIWTVQMRPYLLAQGLKDEQFDSQNTGWVDDYHATVQYVRYLRVPEVFYYVDERDVFYTAKFRWYNGRWWFDGETGKPRYTYSSYINR